MRNAVILLEKVLNDKLSMKDKAKYNILVHASSSGNLPNRVPFIRQVYRQTTLDEFIDVGVGDIKQNVGKMDIIYTVHTRQLQEDKIAKTHEMLIKDLDDYIFSKR